MPFYEYECKACNHRLEVLQKMSDPRLTECPACGKPELVKLMSAAGAFVVKEGRKGSAAPAPACGMAGGCGGCAVSK